MHKYPRFDLRNMEKAAKCRTDPNNAVLLIDKYIRLKVRTEEDLMYVLSHYGPVITSKLYVKFYLNAL